MEKNWNDRWGDNARMRRGRGKPGRYIPKGNTLLTGNAVHVIVADNLGNRKMMPLDYLHSVGDKNHLLKLTPRVLDEIRTWSLLLPVGGKFRIKAPIVDRNHISPRTAIEGGMSLGNGKGVMARVVKVKPTEWELKIIVTSVA